MDIYARKPILPKSKDMLFSAKNIFFHPKNTFFLQEWQIIEKKVVNLQGFSGRYFFVGKKHNNAIKEKETRYKKQTLER